MTFGLKGYALGVAAGALVAGALISPAPASAAIITYTVDQAFGDGSVRGTLTTDGTFGLLLPANSSRGISWSRARAIRSRRSN